MTRGFDKQLEAFAERHRTRGILIDTNVLLLLLFSLYNPQLIGRKRLEKYTGDDGELIKQYVQRFERILTTPHVLAETSNLVGQTVEGKIKSEFMERLHPMFCLDRTESFKQCVIDGKSVALQHFVELGLTDSGLAALARRRKRLLLTDDLSLYVASISSGGDAINFTHMREAAGLL